MCGGDVDVNEKRKDTNVYSQGPIYKQVSAGPGSGLCSYHSIFAPPCRKEFYPGFSTGRGRSDRKTANALVGFVV
jgi:hypothetical protein